MISPHILVDAFTPTGSEPPAGMALKPATVSTPDGSDPGDTHCIIDGDLDPTPILSLVGAVNHGARVMVLFFPPQGAYIVGVIGGHAWHDVTLNTGWVNYGAGTQAAQYRLAGNTVKLRGVVARTSGAATLIATLPAGFRPQYQENFAVDSDANAHSNVFVKADGTINWGQGAAATPTYVSLSGVEFDPYDFV